MNTPNASTLDELNVLMLFSMEPVHNRAVLERYINLYPRYTNSLVDLSVDLMTEASQQKEIIMTPGYKEAVDSGFVGTETEYNELIAHSEIVVLDDQSGFFIGKLPLPDDHWLFSEEDDCEFTPIIGIQHRNEVRRAVQVALRRCTRNGADMDFDPDALVLNVCYYLTGPYGVVENIQSETQ